jgi:hypothetical protein
MAIFAKKKDGRRGSQNGTDLEGESVEIEIPDTDSARPAIAAAAKTDAASTASTEKSADAAPAPATSDGVVKADAVQTETAAATAAVDPEGIESVDIEPEVIEAPVEGAGNPAFGIADAIRLMRSLPADPNMDLVVRVMRVTLGAVNVSVEEIMQEAIQKETKVRGLIAVLDSEVGDLEKQLYAKRCEIAAHQADLKETATVRERLNMADKYTAHPPPPPPDATRIPLPKPREWEPFDSDTPFKSS